MNSTRIGGRRMRRLAIAALSACAVIGGSVAGASSATADTASCAAPTTVVGVVTSAQDLLGCITPAPEPSAPEAPEPSTPAVAPTAVPTSTDVPSPEPTQTPTPTSSVVPAGTESLQRVRLVTTTDTVYPDARGYSKSVVRFSVRGLTAAQTGVRITGEAVLRKGSEVIKTWALSNSVTTLTWDGRDGSKVEAGLYRLTATAWSSDGSKAVSSMNIRVSTKRLVTRTVSIRTRDLAAAKTDTLPIAVVKGFRYGPVTLRIHTFAKVSGRARLVISGPYGERFSIPLRDGKHVTPRATLPREFTSAAFHHEWKRGAAKLIDLYTVFTYKQLV